MPKLTEISVNSYVHLHTINVSGNNLVAIPEELGLLPCLSEINLSHNQLGLANNWNWLVSPFMRENLRDLRLDRNEASICKLCRHFQFWFGHITLCVFAPKLITFRK